MKNFKRSLPSILQLLLALFLTVGVSTFLGPCVHADGKIGPCVKAAGIIKILGGCLAALSVLSLVIRCAKAKTVLAALSIIAAAGVFFVPGTFHRLCMIATMRCHTVMKPASMLLAAFIALSAAAELIINIRQLNGAKQK